MTSHWKKLAYTLYRDTTKLRHALSAYQMSYDRCIIFRDTKDLAPDQEIELEAFTARFARLADLLTQRVLKGLFIVMQEDIRTFVDRAHFAEKLGLVGSADILRLIRELRNRIAHEYEEEDLREIHRLIFEVHVELLAAVNNTLKYSSQMTNRLKNPEEE